MTYPRTLLLTGTPGVGKTTVVLKTVALLSGRRVAGFHTEEIRRGGTRLGFSLSTHDGDEIVMAHVDLPKRHRVGRYGVDVEAIDRIARHCLVLKNDVDVYIVDEIGKMECLSMQFANSMRALLDSNKAVVATIALRGSGFIAEVKHRPDVKVREVTHGNRDELPARVVAWINSAAPAP